MPAPTCGHPSINLQLPGANAVMSDIPVELPASPSSLDVDHERLTVRPRHCLLFVDRPLLTRKRLVHYAYEGKLIIVCPSELWPPSSQRSAYFPLNLVGNR